MVRTAIRFLGSTAALACGWALLGAGPAAAGPIGMVCTNGPSFSLTATTGSIETPDANSVFMWGYANDATGGAFQLPGPVLCVNQGDTVSVTLTNGLTEPTSIVFPGQDDVTASGGSAGLFAHEAAPGGSVTYTFDASQPGTYLYESGTDPATQVEMGLYGAIVVRPAGHPDWAYGNATTRFDPSREYLLVFHELDSDLHHAVETGVPYDLNAPSPYRYFTVTGRAFPDTIADNGVSWLPTQPYGSLVRVKPYDAVGNPLPALIRMVNAGLLNHPFHPHGYHVRTIAQDGRLFLTPAGADASTEHFGDVVPAGATQDSLFTFVDRDRFCEGTACSAAGWPSNPLPVTVPSYRNLRFKDNQTWYSGSPYLGQNGTLPTMVTSYNVCGEFYFPWHSHALNEFVNYDAGFGGLATLLRVDPLVGCTAFPAATKISATPPNTAVSGTLKSGSFASLTADDTTYYQLNSTTTATPPAPNTFKVDWYGGFTGIPKGAANLKVTYKGNCSLACDQTVSVWNWRTSTWLQIDPASGVRTVGATDVAIADVAVPPGPGPGTWADYVGTGASVGQARVRVYDRRTGAAFVSSGNLMKIVYDAP